MAPVNIRVSPLGILLICIFIVGLIFYTWSGKSYNFYFFDKTPSIPDSDSPSVSMKELLSASLYLAEKGGNRVREIREMKEKEQLGAEVKGMTAEGAKELKTNGDMQSHIQIVYGFNKGFPKLKVISEEKESKHSSTNVPYPNIDLRPSLKNDADVLVPWEDVVVWVDPLDATQEYTENLTQYVTTMVCVVVKGKPIMGVIHNPFEKKTSWAWVGHGHSDDLEMVPDTDITKPRIIISRSHAGKMEEAGKEAFPGGLEMIPAGGAGYKVLSLFRKKADAYVHVTKIKKWDICAGNAILNALGGTMMTLEGEVIDYSDKDDAAVTKGLLATLHNHKFFLGKIKPVFEALPPEKPRNH